MRISLESRGEFQRTEKFLSRMSKSDIFSTLGSAGTRGVRALASATPAESGATAAAWSYEVKKTGRSYSIIWSNSNVQQGVPIAIILQYGHATGTGGYVAGRNYINPAIKPVFDEIANDVWKAVTSA